MRIAENGYVVIAEVKRFLCLVVPEALSAGSAVAFVSDVMAVVGPVGHACVLFFGSSLTFLYTLAVASSDYRLLALFESVVVHGIGPASILNCMTPSINELHSYWRRNVVT